MKHYVIKVGAEFLATEEPALNPQEAVILPEPLAKKEAEAIERATSEKCMLVEVCPSRNEFLGARLTGADGQYEFYPPTRENGRKFIAAITDPATGVGTLRYKVCEFAKAHGVDNAERICLGELVEAAGNRTIELANFIRAGISELRYREQEAVKKALKDKN
ncbi:hypothetical protein GC174_14845 [bacterium]|nr:hypothetical protein [bacterium]